VYRKELRLIRVKSRLRHALKLPKGPSAYLHDKGGAQIIPQSKLELMPPQQTHTRHMPMTPCRHVSSNIICWHALHTASRFLVAAGATRNM
jgi:hypothetical protein